ncbi:lytic transglycosylase [Labrys miyagiensis]|uniref:Lytic transglycosylase n=2 Tax=Labrys miyagiensis TaxID=346912 RepID=A0ABQ6CCX6_9HYPH|nr:lytic transglycosylase [Labrys miyagiensis]
MGSRYAAMLSGVALLGAAAMQSASADEANPPVAALGPVNVTVVEGASETTRETARANVAAQNDQNGISKAILGSDTRRQLGSSPLVVDIKYRAPDGPRCPDGNVPADTIKEMIQSEAQAQGVDAKLALAIAEKESDWGQNNNSDAGARGPMQLMPDTAAQYRVSDICDAARNIKGGITFLKDLDTEFGGNVFLILAAYNAGQEAVYKARGVPAYRETVNYVATVANAYYGYDNALQRGKGVPVGSGHVVPISDTQGAKAESQGILLINQPSTEKPTNPWIGGTVLYVGNTGDGN